MKLDRTGYYASKILDFESGSWRWGFSLSLPGSFFLSGLLGFFFESSFLLSSGLFQFQLFLTLCFDLVSPLLFLVDEASTLLQDLFFSLSNNCFSSLIVCLSRMKFVDDFLVEPRTELSIQFTLKRSSEETFGVKDLVSVVLEVFHVLL